MKVSRWLSLFASCLAVAMVLSLALAAPIFAQGTNAVFTGTVTDPSGGVVPQAEVKVTNLGTALTLSVKSDSGGLYRASELPVGQYKIEVSAKGFKTSVRNFLTLNAGTIERVDFQLELGESKQVVTVEGGAPIVNTEDYRLAQTVTGTQIANLPLNGRNLYDLMQLAPGAADVKGVMFENGHNTVVNGLRENFNGFLLNGVSNKGLSGGAVTVVNPDIVQEFQQLTLNMSAQYGNSAGTVTNVITKSGTNEFHGDVYEFIRNNHLDANSFFNNQGGVDRPRLEFNQFGGAINGPIKKDKLFFTASYQGDRFIAGAPPVPVLVESPQWRSAIQAVAPNSVAALLYKNFPPTVTGTPDAASGTLNNFVNSSGSSAFGNFWSYMCPSQLDTFAAANGKPPSAQAVALAGKFQNLFGVTAADQAGFAAGCPGFPTPAISAGQLAPFGGRNIPFFEDSIASFRHADQGQPARWQRVVHSYRLCSQPERPDLRRVLLAEEFRRHWPLEQ